MGKFSVKKPDMSVSPDGKAIGATVLALIVCGAIGYSQMTQPVESTGGMPENNYVPEQIQKLTWIQRLADGSLYTSYIGLTEDLIGTYPQLSNATILEQGANITFIPTFAVLYRLIPFDNPTVYGTTYRTYDLVDEGNELEELRVAGKNVWMTGRVIGIDNIIFYEVAWRIDNRPLTADAYAMIQANPEMYSDMFGNGWIGALQMGYTE